MFVDRLSVHRSKFVRERLDELSIPLVYNASYEPDYMPIENVFALVKHNFRQSRLFNIALNRPDKVEMQIKDAFNKINRLYILKCIRRAHETMRNEIRK